MITTVMDTIYDWINEIVNNTVVPSPGIPIIPSHADIPAPSGVYITFNYTPLIEIFGQADYKVEEIGGIVYKTLRTDCEGAVEIWESNGNGEQLLKLLSYQWKDSINEILSNNNISIMRSGQMTPIPSIQPEDKWQKESVVEFIFGFGAGIRFETDDITNIEVDGTLKKEDGSERDVFITQ